MDFLTVVGECETQDAARDLFDRLSSDQDLQKELTSYYVLSPNNARLAFNNLRRKVGRGYKKDVDEVHAVIKNQADAKASSILSAQATPSIHASFESPPSERFLPTEYARNVFVPFGYRLSDNGLSYLKVENEEAVEVPIIADPVFISSTTLDNHTKERRIILLYKDVDQFWKEIQCTLEDIGSNNKILQLAKTGLQINQNNAPALVKFFAKFFELNRRALPNIHTTAKMGWHQVGEEWVWVWPDKTLGKSSQGASLVFKAKDGGQRKARAFREKGTLEECIHIMSKVSHLPVPYFCVYTALAGLLMHDLKPRRVHGFTLDLGAPTGTGKSTCGYFFGFAVGRPGFEMDDTGTNWSTTTNQLEELCGFYNSVPVVIDETKLLIASRGRNFATSILTNWAYAQHQGQGKKTLRRDRTMRKPPTWHNTCMITGESTLTSMVRDNEGARARLIPIEELAFGEPSEQTADLIVDLNNSMQESYGVFGRRFVELLLQIREHRPKLITTLYDRHRERIKSLAGNNSVAIRVAEYIAAIMTAGDLLHDYVKVPRPAANIWGLVERIMKNVGYQSNRGDIALRDLVESLQENPYHVIGLGATENSSLFAAWPTAKKPYLLVTKKSFSTFCLNYGHSERTVLTDWIKKGYLKITGIKADNSMRNYTHVINKASVSNRYIVGNSSRTISGYAIKEEYIKQLLAMSYYSNTDEISDEVKDKIKEQTTKPPPEEAVEEVPW